MKMDGFKTEEILAGKKISRTQLFTALCGLGFQFVNGHRMYMFCGLEEKSLQIQMVVQPCAFKKSRISEMDFVYICVRAKSNQM